ncbi:MAG: hypothetical protein NTV51_03835, partial [Verrucomicrobia bacterium]|nr:hypothetical protein [Verrucomicrobiota bacterium]
MSPPGRLSPHRALAGPPALPPHAAALHRSPAAAQPRSLHAAQRFAGGVIQRAGADTNASRERIYQLVELCSALIDIGKQGSGETLMSRQSACFTVS